VLLLPLPLPLMKLLTFSATTLLLTTRTFPSQSYSPRLLLTRSQATLQILLSGVWGWTGIKTPYTNKRMSTTMSSDGERGETDARKTIRILLNGGDNMLGRAIQLSFPVQAPGEEEIRDSCTASHYVSLALNHPSGHGDDDKDPSLAEIRKRNNGQQDESYLWDGYTHISIRPAPDLRILNFESAITRSIANPDLPLWKGIRYHTHVDNLDAMLRPFVETNHGAAQASPVVLSLSNNHVMDYGRTAFEEETLPALSEIQDSISPLLRTVGSGSNWQKASQPAVISVGDPEEGVAVDCEIFAFASGCSGTPEEWAASARQSGLVRLPSLYSQRAVEEAMLIVKGAFAAHSQTSPPSSSSSRERPHIRIVSVHMGPNWALKHEGSEEIAARREFAHRLIDECDVDLIYGHSSHHVRGMEVYKGKLILYGTGDMINDYEGFENRGEEQFNKLGAIYVVDMNTASGDFVQAKIVPMFMNRLRIERFTPSSKLWKPNERMLQVEPQKSVDLARFINQLSRTDSGMEQPQMVLEHVDEDDEIPGGPVLVSKWVGTARE